MSEYIKWRKYYSDAENYMDSVYNNSGTLIEVAAQHPLTDSGEPGDEFRARLDSAIKFYYNLEKPSKFYIPGSLHKFNGKVDRVSLSEAGKQYLIKNGIPENDIYAEDANKEFKPDGVYNSSDECYVTANLFKKLGYGRLVCFCSPAQLMRKALSYIQFGVIPDIYSVPIKNMFHNYVDETFRYMPELINDKTGLQSNSKEAERLRKLRKP